MGRLRNGEPGEGVAWPQSRPPDRRRARTGRCPQPSSACTRSSRCGGRGTHCGRRLRERVDWLPPKLAHSGDVHARWADPDCRRQPRLRVAARPLARRRPPRARRLLADRSPRPTGIAIAARSCHRTTSPSPTSSPPTCASWRTASTACRAGSACCTATVGEHDAWPGEVTFSGAHVESLRTLAERKADLACVDSWSLRSDRARAARARQRPAPTRPRAVDPEPGGHRARHGAGRRRRASSRRRSSTCSPTTPRQPIREALLVDGFVRLTIDDYLPVLTLAERIRRERRRGPLDGLIVADLSRVLAGPYCTMLLADMGATVIKVESPAGDETRTWTPPEHDGVVDVLPVDQSQQAVDRARLQRPRRRRADPRAVAPRRRRGGELQARRARASSGSTTSRREALNPRLVYLSISGFGTAEGRVAARVRPRRAGRVGPDEPHR